MKMMQIAAVGLTAAVLVPATAQAQQGAIPPVRFGVNPCEQVTLQFRQSIAAAQEAKQAAFRAAQVQFHAATSDERSALAAATGKAMPAGKAFRVETATERADRKAARKAAQSAYRDAVKAAQGLKRAGMKSCR